MAPKLLKRCGKVHRSNTEGRRVSDPCILDLVFLKTEVRIREVDIRDLTSGACPWGIRPHSPPATDLCLQDGHTVICN